MCEVVAFAIPIGWRAMFTFPLQSLSRSKRPRNTPDMYVAPSYAANSATYTSGVLRGRVDYIGIVEVGAEVVGDGGCRWCVDRFTHPTCYERQMR